MKSLTTILLVFFSTICWAQSFVTRDIKSFGAKGDGKTNDHEAFERAATYFNERGGNGKLIVSKGTYLVGKQTYNRNTTAKPVYEGETLLDLNNISNFSIEGVNQPVIRYCNGLHFGSFVPATGEPSKNGKDFYDHAYIAEIKNAIHLTNCKNIIISNLELDGNNNNFILGGMWGDVDRQLPHCGIFLKNSTIVTINNVKSHHFGLDGIQIMNETGNSKIKDQIVITNSTFEYNARQGLSWVGGNDLTVLKSSFNHTGKGKFASLPSAGVDIEAEVGTVSNGKFVNCQFINNTGCGMVADSGPSSNCSFDSCLFWGVTAWSVWVHKPGFTFNNCTFYGSIVHGYTAGNDVEATKYLNCYFEDKPYQGKEVYGNFVIETNFANRMRFENCTFKANKKNLMWVAGNDNLKDEEKYQFINCQFIFNGANVPTGNAIRYRNCKFEITDPTLKKKSLFLANEAGKILRQ